MLAVSFVNQVLSRQCTLGVFDACGEFAWVPMPRDFTGCAGLATDGRFLWAVTQGAPACVLTFDALLHCVHVRELVLVKDAHSLCLHDGALHCVSTETNRVVRMEFDANGVPISETVEWTVDEALEDQVHINHIVEEDGELFVTMFGRADYCGRVVSREHGEVWALLNQPHSAQRYRGDWVIAESAKARIWYGANAVGLKGYPRGIASQHDRLWVGCSAPRRVKQTIDHRRFAQRCALAEIKVSDHAATVEALHDMHDLGSEIYDVLALPDSFADGVARLSPDKRRAEKHRFAMFEMAATRAWRREI